MAIEYVICTAMLIMTVATMVGLIPIAAETFGNIAGQTAAQHIVATCP